MIEGVQRPRVVLIDCSQLAPHLKKAGVSTHSFRSPAMAYARVRKLQPRMTVVRIGEDTEFSTPDVIRRLRSELPLSDVLVWAPDSQADLVREALLAGAHDVVLSADPGAVVGSVDATLDAQQFLPRMLEIEGHPPESCEFERMLSRSRRMWDLFDTCVRTAPTDAAVLILGETGTGKELLARALHRRSGKRGEFVALNCAAVPEELIDSELFGHLRGAFTGAQKEKQGLFRAADRGTLFLDEIGSIPLSVQNRLLRTLQEGTVRPVGGEEELPADARIVAATATDLEQAVDKGTFRPDLLYRLDVIRLIIPPLRERPEDILFLFVHFIRQLAKQYNIDRPDLSDSFIDELQAHDWPGNVRELENFSERLLLTQSGSRRTRRHFRALMKPYGNGLQPSRHSNNGALDSPLGVAIDLRKTLPEEIESAVSAVERAYIEECLTHNRGRIGITAEQAGISRRTLLRKMKRYGLDKHEYRL